MPREEFDLIVIGGGSGGLAASKRAASHGAKVAIVEESEVGGTCVIRGCIPKKLMVYAAKLGQSRHLAQGYGWTDELGELDWPKLATFRNSVVQRLETMHETNLTKANVTLIRGRAHFINPFEIAVGDVSYKAKKFIIATGSTPSLPPIEGIDLAESSDGLWKLADQPKKITIVGGGYIAVEFASLLQNLGCQTTLLVRSALLREFDSDLGSHLEQCLLQQGITVKTKTTIKKLTREAGSIRVVATEGSADYQSDGNTAVIFATGRKANTENLGLSTAAVQTNPQGAILVNSEHATSAPHIFAVGDVLGHSMLTPVAIKAGRSVADREFGNQNPAMSYGLIPTAIFSSPPIGTVGLSEAEAIKAYGKNDISVYHSRFNPLLYSPCAEKEKVKTLMKLLVQTTTDRVLGFHMVGDDAPEIIQGFAAALTAGITKAQLDSTIAIHPSSAEEFVLMR